MWRFAAALLPIDTGGCSAQQLARHREISTARRLQENFVVPFLHILSPLDNALIEKPMFMQVGLFCTSNLSSGTALQQDFVIWWIIWQPSTLPNICHLQWLCLKSIRLMTRVSQLAFFLMKVTGKQFVKWLSLKEIISGLRLNFWSWDKLSDWDCGRSKCHYHVHHVWCLDPENMKDFLERVWDYQAKHAVTTLWFVASLHVPWHDVPLLYCAAALLPARKSFPLCRKPS